MLVCVPDPSLVIDGMADEVWELNQFSFLVVILVIPRDCFLQYDG
jgi:hypothetical protein